MDSFLKNLANRGQNGNRPIVVRIGKDTGFKEGNSFSRFLNKWKNILKASEGLKRLVRLSEMTNP